MKSISFLLFLFWVKMNDADITTKRALQPSHELSKSEKWRISFIHKKFEDSNIKVSLVDLVVSLSQKYFKKCTPIITYDKSSENVETVLINSLLLKFGIPQIHGDATKENASRSNLYEYNDTCKDYILFLEDVMDTNKILGYQNQNRVIIVTKSSQWRVHEYLSSRSSQKIVNLLVISKSEMVVKAGEQSPFVLYTHKLYIDAIASSKHVVLTSWRNGRFTRPDLNLFPKKIAGGFSGHRFMISLADFPPYVIKDGVDSNDNIIWDGIEVRLVKLLAKKFNFTVDFFQASDVNILGTEKAVIRSVAEGKGNLGLSGIFGTNEILEKVDTSNILFEDCAAFMTLTSTALPRYRAIMGPFHWTVWLSLTLIYLFAIFPLTFSYKHTLKPLLKNPEEMENMFWYVFGTFTNAFTFNQGESWTKSDKAATRVFIGFYWIFTIIISACYTGSIIAFVTLPIYPETIDEISQLVGGRYQIGTLDNSGWADRFANSSESLVEKLMRKIDLVPSVEEGIKNTTEAFFWPYAFLGSRANLDYIIRTQFVSTKRRSALHLSDKCLVSYGTAITYTKNSEYVTVLNAGLDRMIQGGFLVKILRDVEWRMMRSASGKRLAAIKGRANPLTVEDRALTLEDTQGMFLLLGIGFTLSGISLFFEIFGGCFNFCKKKDRLSSTGTLSSNPRSYDGVTRGPVTDRARIIFTLNHLKSSRSMESSLCSSRSEYSDEESVDLTGLEKEIDNLFDFEEYFGEKNAYHMDIKEKSS